MDIPRGMTCPECGKAKMLVTTSWDQPQRVHRKRVCPECKYWVGTEESITRKPKSGAVASTGSGSKVATD